MLAGKAAAAEETGDPLEEAPELERAWRVYLRRPASDVAHVALEWRDTRTGDLLVTGKASEWRGHVVSADSNRLTERWYTFRPTEAFDLGTLPFTQDGRIVSLAGFHERLDEADKADSALQVRWVDRRGEWTEHLDSLRLGPLVLAAGEKAAAAAIHREALARGERLVVSMAARKGEEAERHRILSERHSDVEVRERGLDAEARRLNSVVLELNRLVAKLRWDTAVAERKRLESERDDTRDLLAAWRAIDVLVRYNAAHDAAETIRETIRRQEVEAEPVLRTRDRAAMRFARGLLGTAATADGRAARAETQAGQLQDDLRVAGDEGNQSRAPG
jgi:hypothetical protein